MYLLSSLYIHIYRSQFPRVPQFLVSYNMLCLLVNYVLAIVLITQV